MKLFILLLVALSFTHSPTFGQDNTSYHSDSLEVKVRLKTQLDSIRLPAYCGIAYWKMAFEFDVLELVSGDYQKSTIDIIIGCPREAVENKWLEQGKEYTYKVCKSRRESPINSESGKEYYTTY